MNQQPKLNYDILLIVMEYAPRSVVASLRQTCKMLRDAGTTDLFRTPVALASNNVAQSFSHFFLSLKPSSIASPSSPCVLLWCLVIHLEEPSEATVRALQLFFTRVAPTMPNMTQLALYDAEDLLQSCRYAVAIGIARLTQLTALKVVGTGRAAYSMLRRLCSPLVSAHIDHVQNTSPEFDSATLLKNCRKTLEVLDLRMTGGIGAKAPVFPRLRKLSLLYYGLQSHSDLAAACPNLQELHLVESVGMPRGYITYQREFNQCLLPSEMCSSLRTFTGSLDALYLLGLQCPMSAVHITDERSQYRLVSAVQAVLWDIKPEHFTLSTDLAGASCYLDTAFVGMMIKAGTWQWSLKTLELEVLFRDSEKSINLQDVLVNIADITAAASQIEAFRLCLDVSRIGSSPHAPRRNGEMSPVEEALQSLDGEAFLEDLLERRPSLTTIILQIDGHRIEDVNYTMQIGPDIANDTESREDNCRDL